MATLNLNIIRGNTELAESVYQTQIRPLLDSAEITEVSDPQNADYRFVLGGDRFIICTPQGSTAYNLSERKVTDVLSPIEWLPWKPLLLKNSQISAS